ncbi:MAG: heavy metal-responsive transcriptional regulator [Deltaproteobacteria bacterium]|nr:MAG: heavy metal-responsive transcriptional regulator [Deltaproteobacteria bacterium]
MEAKMDKLLIGELAEKVNVNKETIRYYERKGLIPNPPRNDSGHRQYSEIDIKRTEFIKRTQSLGFSLKEIKDLLMLKIEPGTTCKDIQKIVELKIVDVDQKITDLMLIKKTLKNLAGRCTSKGPVSDCPILDELEK